MAILSTATKAEPSRALAISDVASKSDRSLLTGENSLSGLPPSFQWSCDLWLKQGFEGACVGFAWAHEMAANPVCTAGIDASFAREKIYFEAQRIDRFRGGAYRGARPFAEGTSVIAGARVLKAMGYIEDYRTAADIVDLLVVIADLGPVVFGCPWYHDMQHLCERDVAKPTGSRFGKHCVLITGFDLALDQQGGIDEKSSFLRFRNSFGRDWGSNGDGKLSLASTRQLWPDAEICIPLGRKPVALSESRAAPAGELSREC